MLEPGSLPRKNGAVPSPAGRILIVDDNPAIHDDFRKILRTRSVEEDTLDKMTRELFGRPARPVPQHEFALDSAYQGREAVARVEAALIGRRPYALVFLDVRMPPGWDGLDTLEAIWRVDPRVHVVLCTAYADYSWDEIVARVGETDRLLILKKPFQSSEVRQLAHSITAKWRLARTLEQRFADLEDRVQARTAELEAINRNLRREIEEHGRIENKLRRAQRMEALGRLAAGLGHEINNPLTFLIASLESIQSELDQYQQRIPLGLQSEIDTLLGTSLVGAERITQIVRNIKRFARPTEDASERVDVGKAIDGAVAAVAKELGPRTSVEVALADRPYVTARRTDLDLVFTSLLEHAAQAVASAPPPGRIRISTHRDRSDDLVIEILDSGMGIASEDLHKVFEPGSATKVLNQGAGLGLSICHAIVMGLDGSMDVQSAPEQGTAIMVRLPGSLVEWSVAPAIGA
jgi:two-component system NtrC family sensor kinase